MKKKQEVIDEMTEPLVRQLIASMKYQPKISDSDNYKHFASTMLEYKRIETMSIFDLQPEDEMDENLLSKIPSNYLISLSNLASFAFFKMMMEGNVIWDNYRLFAAQYENAVRSHSQVARLINPEGVEDA